MCCLLAQMFYMFVRYSNKYDRTQNVELLSDRPTIHDCIHLISHLNMLYAFLDFGILGVVVVVVVT